MGWFFYVIMRLNVCMYVEWIVAMNDFPYVQVMYMTISLLMTIDFDEV